MADSLAARLGHTIRSVPDFPRAGVLFKDITPLLANPALLREALSAMSRPFATSGITHVVGVESRGFLFGVPVAQALDASFVPARKPGKLPWQAASESFWLEYGQDTLEIHSDAFSNGARVLIVDDILATGGTADATSRLVTRLGGTVIAISVLGEITALGARTRLTAHSIHSLIQF